MQQLTKPLAERANRFATRVVDESSDPRKNSFTIRRADLIGAVTEALTNSLAVRRARFPNRASELLTRFASDRLPGSTIRALRTVAEDALRTAISKQTRSPDRISPPAKSARGPRAQTLLPRPYRRKSPPKARKIFSSCAVFVPTGGLCILRTTKKAKAAGFDSVAAWVDSLTLPPASERRAFINARIDALLAPIRRHALTYPDARNERCRVAHIALLEEARAHFLASVTE